LKKNLTMININLNTITLTIVLMFCIQPKEAHSQPLGQTGNWELVKEFSDEFTDENVNTKKWENNPSDWGPSSFEPELAYQKDGKLYLKTIRETHTRKGLELYYKTSILLSQKTITYGYFEASIKGCGRFPGICPAFWLYSRGNNYREQHNGATVTYSEIDIMEIQQGGYDFKSKKEKTVKQIDCNLHTRILDETGNEKWIRPQQAPELCKHDWLAPWDPRDDYHVYACENRPDSIFWYIDGKEVARAENKYWHLPMHLTFTMELRPPLMKFENGKRIPLKETSSSEDFPTQMSIEYVRTWLKKED